MQHPGESTIYAVDTTTKRYTYTLSHQEKNPDV